MFGRRLPGHPVARLCLAIGLGEAVALAAVAYAAVAKAWQAGLGERQRPM